MRLKGFSPLWLSSIMQMVRGGQTAININGEPGPYFRNSRGVRQGDPVSPLLFNIIVEALAVILEGARRVGQIQGVFPELMEGGITHLQYADDTLIIIKNDPVSLANLKFLLMCFESMSGLKINYDKSEVYVTKGDLEERLRAAHILNCRLGSLPIKYLGMPLTNKHLTIEDFLFITDRVAQRVEPWVGKYQSMGGKTTLINSCLSSLPMFVMGFFLLQDGVHAKFDSVRSRFFRGKELGKQKYHMVHWSTICAPKEVGGLGIINTKHNGAALKEERTRY